MSTKNWVLQAFKLYNFFIFLQIVPIYKENLCYYKRDSMFSLLILDPSFTKVRYKPIRRNQASPV